MSRRAHCCTTHLMPPNGNFREIKIYWYMYVPVFWRLQHIFEANGIVNFRLVPLYKAGPKFVHFSTVAMQAFRNVSYPKSVAKTDRSDKTIVWDVMIFNFEEHHTSGRSFDGALNTDGVAANLQMARVKTAPVAPETGGNYLRRIERNYANGQYKYVMGNDPDRKSVSFLNTVHVGTTNFTKTNPSALTFRHEVGEFARRQHRLKLCGAVDREIEEDRAVFPLSEPTKKQIDVMQQYKNMFDIGTVSKSRYAIKKKYSKECGSTNEYQQDCETIAVWEEASTSATAKIGKCSYSWEPTTTTTTAEDVEEEKEIETGTCGNR